ncbi:MAG: aspartate carbamoyltransferase [Candidatus Micrarchaeota archaeon]|nr:aspartate carbamoyltransferase [Candidatus Micrarchaeota archaeon]
MAFGKGSDLISISDLEKKEIEAVFARAKKFEDAVKAGKVKRTLEGRVVASLFFEASTRTRLSSASAANHLGARVIGFSGIEGTSVQKGETLSDTIEMVDKYIDAIFIRHPLDGAARLAAEVAKHPVINCGDGSNQHPTQTLLDLYTMRKEFGRIDGLEIALVGDLKYGRTVHSLALALNHYKVRLKFVSHPSLKMPDYIRKEVSNPVAETERLDIGKCDVVYVTRIQKERFSDLMEYERVKGIYKITPGVLEGAKKGSIVMHPLPRVDEISRTVDATPNARYFQQAGNGLFIRMAVLDAVMNG